MLNPDKKALLLSNLKNYKKKYMQEKYMNLDESGTRIMINQFLTEILGYEALDEVKTEQAIKGTYADYVININGNQHFLVEVKSIQIALSDKHLRQAQGYASDEGVDWMLLTNGKDFELYRLIFEKPMQTKLVMSFTLIDGEDLRSIVEQLQYLTRPVVVKDGLEYLWNRFRALAPENIASFLYSSKIISILKKELKEKYHTSFEEEDIFNALTNVITESISGVKPVKERKKAEKPRNILENKEDKGSIEALPQVANGESPDSVALP
jgi:hypothetical protein